MEAPIPGTAAYEAGPATTRYSENKLWHFHFHFHFHGAAGNEAETLIAGWRMASWSTVPFTWPSSSRRRPCASLRGPT